MSHPQRHGRVAWWAWSSDLRGATRSWFRALYFTMGFSGFSLIALGLAAVSC